MRRLFSILLLAAGACSAEAARDPGAGGPPSAPAATAAPSPETPPADPNAEACLSETAALQAALDASHAMDTDAVLAVKNETCGLRVLRSGPSKVQATDLHRIGSVTKTYVAAVILDLAREGKLSLDDKVSSFTDAIDGVTAKDAITVRRLLNHTSGLFNYTNDAEFRKNARGKVWTPRALVDVATAHPSYFAPGEGWEYSNTNYILLGMIAESVGKAKIGALVRARVLSKIGATATFFDGEEPVVGTLARGFDARGNDVTTVADPSWAWAAGAMVATPADVVTWIEKIGNGTFYDAKTQTELLAPIPTGQSGMSYGLGVFVMKPSITGGGGPAVGHGGDIDGFHTQSFYFTERATTLVAIVDSDAESANDVSLGAIDVLFAPRSSP